MKVQVGAEDFQNMDNGEVFCWQGDYYITTEDPGGCVNLETGASTTFATTTQVQRMANAVVLPYGVPVTDS